MKTAYIYLIGPEDGGPLKIGITENLKSRLSTIQTGNPNKLAIHHSIELDNAKKARLIEAKIHNEIKLYKVSGEWYNISLDDAIAEIDYAYIRWNEDWSCN